MSLDYLQGQWTQLLGQARERWGVLRRDPAQVLSGRRARLAGRLQMHRARAQRLLHGKVPAQPQDAAMK